MTARLRVLITADTVGGVWQYATDLAAELPALGIDPVLALLGPAPTPAQRATADELGICLIETGLPLDWLAPDEAAVGQAGRALAEIVRRQGVDLVHLNQPALAAEPMPVPVVAAIHSCVATWWAAVEGGAPPESFAWQTALVRAGLARAAAIVCPSAAFAAAVRAAYVLPVAPQVVHNGRRPLVTQPQAPRDVAFTAGRLWDRGKNAATLDRAAEMLAVPLQMVGPLAGPNGEAIELHHAQALGSLDEAALAERLARQPVFVSAAKYEPFGLAVLEAAQAGCALVLSDISTFRELWGGAATFVDPDNAKGFANAVTALIANPAQRTVDGEAAHRRAERFAPAAMAKGMAAIYRATLEARAAA